MKLIYNEVKNADNEFTYNPIRMPAYQMNSVNVDIKMLGAQLAYYFSIIYKNFKFVSFHDKDFVTAIKTLIKNKEDFLAFLNAIDLSIEDFLKMLVYISPQVFTSNLIKFIQRQYLI